MNVYIYMIYIYIYTWRLFWKYLCLTSFLGGEQKWHYVVEAKKRKRQKKLVNSMLSCQTGNHVCYPVHLKTNSTKRIKATRKARARTSVL